MFVKTALTLAATVVLLCEPAFAQSASEHFGRAKMNAAEIASTIAAMDQRITGDSTKIPTIFGPLSFVEDALYDFGKKYPDDSAVPRDLFALESLYLKLPPDQGGTFAKQIAGWLHKDYAKSTYAARGHEALDKTSPATGDTVAGTAAPDAEPTPSPASAGPPVTTVPSKPKDW